MLKNLILKYIVSNHILFTVILIAAAFFLIEIKSIIVLIFSSYIIMASLNPFVKKLNSFKIPKFISIAITFSFLISFLILLVIPMLPIIITQMQGFFENYPKYIDSASNSLGIKINSGDVSSIFVPAIGTLGKNVIQITSLIFGGIFSLISVFILSFYLLLEKDKLLKSLISNLKEDHQLVAENLIITIEEKLGAWFRGQIVLSLTIGIITWIALTILHVDYALPLAILAGFLEIIPTLGPIIAAIPAIIIALSVSPTLALIVVAAYILIQLAENNILVPKIMEKAVGLNPVVIIIAILIGGNLMGIMGALLSIPFLSAVILIFKKFN